jgi:hypothetical protein
LLQLRKWLRGTGRLLRRMVGEETFGAAGSAKAGGEFLI